MEKPMKMEKTMRTTCFYIILFVFGVCVPMVGFAQGSTSLPGLSNYQIPLEKKGALIGKVVIPSAKTMQEITLLKDTSGLFRLDGMGCIRLKPRVRLKTSTMGFRYGITIGIGGNPVDFELVKDEFILNKVIAHRGAWKNQNVPENSLGSLQRAIELGCEGSEFDVWLSSDKIPVVCHNASVGGKLIEQTTASELQKISLGKDDFVPTLEQYLLAAKHQNRTHLVLEIKSSEISQERSLELTNAVVCMVHNLKVQAWVDYISFNYGVLKRVHELDPDAKTAYLADDKKLEELVADGITGIDYPFYSFHKDETLVKKAHQLGLTVNVWTVDQEEELRYFITQGVDRITTNEPEQLIKLITNH
jgi:glycerophosphoryl diester phosphodiesterase